MCTLTKWQQYKANICKSAVYEAKISNDADKISCNVRYKKLCNNDGHYHHYASPNNELSSLN